MGKRGEPLRKHGKTPGKHRKTQENMQKQGKSLDDIVLFRENMGKHQENIWNTRINIGKTQENNQKRWEILDDKVLFWENTGKQRENMLKHAKTWESIE